jgi:hypothetical protein
MGALTTPTTLEHILAEQKDLDTLCAERPLHTDEICEQNAFYGNSRIIREYADWKVPLKGVLPHGVHLRDDFIWEGEAQARLPLVFCTSPFHADVFTHLSDKIPVLNASPFVYLSELAAGDPPPHREGTIFFPAHSTHHVTSQMDFEALADQLERLDSHLRPVTICVYWRDYNLGWHLPFAARGFPIVSAGHMFDPLFLWRFYGLCSMHLYAASNEIGSSVFYSVKAGCSFFFIEDESINRTGTPKYLQSYDATPRIVRLRQLFVSPVSEISREQQSEVDYYLGTAYMDTPEGLRNKLRLAEHLDWSLASTNQVGKAQIVVPCGVRRWIINGVKRVLGDRVTRAMIRSREFASRKKRSCNKRILSLLGKSSDDASGK